MGEDNDLKDDKPGSVEDIESLIDERQRLDSIFKEKFTRVITVMFTDLKGSTTITEMEGDFATRIMLKQHNDTLLPIIKGNNGILVKTMGDGTMSYFNKPQDAVNTAIDFQKAIDELNLQKKFKVPILVRIGINSGEGIVEKNDIYGDVVNVASRFESSANAGEIYISESTYQGLSDKDQVYCRFVKMATLKGKKEPFKVFKAFWNEEEIEKDKALSAEAVPEKAARKKFPFPVKVLLFVLIPVIVVFLLIKVAEIVNRSSPSEEKRSIRHSVTIPGETEDKKSK